MASVKAVFMSFAGEIFTFYFDMVDFQKLHMSFLGQIADTQFILLKPLLHPIGKLRFVKLLCS